MLAARGADSRPPRWRVSGDCFVALEVDACPFLNLPEAHSGRWGQGLTVEKMAECSWLKPVLVAQFKFVEWTPDGHLRHAKFAGLRGDEDAREVRRE